MKEIAHIRKAGFLLIALWMAATGLSHAQSLDYEITSPVFLYVVTNVPANTVLPGNDPTITLQAGATYHFGISTTPGPSGHPVEIDTTSTRGNRYTNASPQSISSGIITLTIPATNFPTTLWYICTVHGFSGQINIVPPPSPPPPNQIVSVQVVTTNVVLVSTGTNTTWKLIPEFNSNLVSGTWAPVPNFTNSFANGTNTTSFGRLEAICGPNVFLRLKQQAP